ncbi:MAG: transporter substrate-binding domain-containing protein [Tessaracoccus sp.]
MSNSLTSRIAGVAAAALALVALSACSDGPSAPAPTTDDSPAQTAEGFSLENYQKVIDDGAVASDADIEANAWASAVRDAGVLKIGGTETSQLFSLVDPTVSEQAIGFDAGLSQLLATYILGEPNTELSQVTSDTREEVLVTGSVDAVFATYSITPQREERVDFAGPYYSSQAAILVKADNTDIESVEDLAGKTVATQSGSTGVTLLEDIAPEAKVDALPDHSQAIAAVQQGRADAYVIDQSLLLNSLLDNDDLKIVGEPFGPVDPYGIGLPKGSDATEFVNAWLQQIIDDGTWLELWQATIGAKTGTDVVPTPPTVE